MFFKHILLFYDLWLIEYNGYCYTATKRERERDRKGGYRRVWKDERRFSRDELSKGGNYYPSLLSDIGVSSITFENSWPKRWVLLAPMNGRNTKSVENGDFADDVFHRKRCTAVRLSVPRNISSGLFISRDLLSSAIIFHNIHTLSPTLSKLCTIVTLSAVLFSSMDIIGLQNCIIL